MSEVRKALDWVTQGIDWVANGLAQIMDPRWLMRNPGWAAALGLGLVLLVGWLFLFRGRKGL